jgi:cell wall-associated NlpC family hydrolase
MNPGLSPVVSKYVGVPYVEHGRTPAGWDCYGLVYYVSRKHFHYNVPSYLLSYASADTAQDAFAEHVGEWRSIPMDESQPGDVVILYVAGLPIHCGLLVGDGLMLHCMRGRQTCLERVDSLQWNRRIEGAHRWK